jgi:azobenzene reductase
MGQVIKLNILIICGSARKKSRSRSVCRYVRDYLIEKNITSHTFDMREDMLPIYTGEQDDHPNVKKFKELTQQADGFFICTPDYHNGISGSLKNAFDFIGSDQVKGKFFAISAVAGGGKGGINPLNQLRLVIRGIYGMVLASQVVVDRGHFDADQVLENEEIKKRLSQMVDELIFYLGRRG